MILCMQVCKTFRESKIELNKLIEQFFLLKCDEIIVTSKLTYPRHFKSYLLNCQYLIYFANMETSVFAHYCVFLWVAHFKFEGLFVNSGMCDMDRAFDSNWLINQINKVEFSKKKLCSQRFDLLIYFIFQKGQLQVYQISVLIDGAMESVTRAVCPSVDSSSPCRKSSFECFILPALSSINLIKQNVVRVRS